MERPALQRLLKDIEDGKVDTIVVYKVDRLTRSLADFAKIVEALDARGVSFVSVTQQFNTTTSMGRLTLNVLLSFAQESIWRNAIFPRSAIRGPAEPDYLGEIQHRRKVYPGEHAGIIPRELWEQVQAQLRSDNQGRRNGLKANCSSLLAGLLEDAEDNRFTPSHTVKNGKRYRYYVCQGKVDAKGTRGKPTRVPAHDVEKQVSLSLQAFLQSMNEVMDRLTQQDDSPVSTQQIIAAAGKQSEQLRSDSPSSVQDFLRKVVQRVVVHPDKIDGEVSKSELRVALAGARSAALCQGTSDMVRLALEARIKRCGGEMRLVVPPHLPGHVRAHPVPSLLRVLARARQWYEGVIAGEVWGGRSIAQKTGLDERYVSQILECAFLAPDIVQAILDGRRPENLTWKKLTRHVPMNWVEQRKNLGFPPASVDVTWRYIGKVFGCAFLTSPVAIAGNYIPS